MSDAMYATAQIREKEMKVLLDNEVTVELSNPVVVAVSKTGEKRWGYHQFMNLSKYPGSRILLRFNKAADAVSAYGTPCETFISNDRGKTWKPYEEPGLPTSGIVAEVFNGEFLCVPPPLPLNISTHKLTMPKPVAKFFAYTYNVFYRLSECQKIINDYFKELRAFRWIPETMTWSEENIAYDIRDALVWTRAEGKEKYLVPNTWFEHPPLKIGDELIYADYRRNYLTSDGTVPKNRCVSCMVSKDNGGSFLRRATIPIDPTGKDLMAEPMLARDINGNLICVIRRTDHNQNSMMITYSKDRGHTWEKPIPMDDLGNFGVFPAVLQLDCGVIALSYGRPGVHLTFSLDGTGRKWTKPIVILPGDPDNLLTKTDGYTNILDLSSSEFLLGYTDFEYQDQKGEKRKAILVRKITIHKKAKF